MSVTQSRTIQQIAADRERAEIVLAEAKSTADSLRVEHATAVLREAFPHHTLAVFGRPWDEDAPHLVQLLSSEEGVSDIDLDDSDDENALTRAQSAARGTADRAIRLLGRDDEVSQHLARGEEEHEDWYEFDLPLSTHGSAERVAS